MRSSALPTLALAVLLLAAGAFGTWYMLAAEPETPRAPSAARETGTPEAARPASLPQAPLDRAGEGAANAPANPPESKPAAAPKPESAGVSGTTPGREATPAPGRTPSAEEVKALAEKMAEDIRAGRLPMPAPGENPQEWENAFGGPKIDFVATLCGTVTDAAGAPLAGARVYAEFSEKIERSEGTNRRVAIAIARSSGEEARGTPLATTDGAGSFSAEVRRKIGEQSSLSVSLTAGAEGSADSKPVRITLRNGESRDGIVLAVRGAGSVTGRVVDGSGRGVEGVKVTIGGADGNIMVMGSDTELELPGGGSPRSAVTDNGGNFAISGLAEGRYKPRLSATGWRQVSGPTEVAVRAGQETKCPADFVVAAAAALRATFVDAQGKPARGWASVRFLDGGTVVKTMSGTLAKDGSISLNDPPVGSFEIELRVFGYAPHSVQATISEGLVSELGILTLQPAAEDEQEGGIVIPGD